MAIPTRDYGVKRLSLGIVRLSSITDWPPFGGEVLTCVSVREDLRMHAPASLLLFVSSILVGHGYCSEYDAPPSFGRWCVTVLQS